MNTKKEPSPFARLWGWAGEYHGGFYGAVVLAVLGVACNMLAYFCIAIMLRLLLSGGGLGDCLPWCGLLLAAYGGKSLFSTWSTSMSHTATYHTLRDLRKSLLSKLGRVPMGAILDTPSGQYKTTIVDRVEGMEPTLAHLIPEMTANLLVPIAVAVCIFALDWRMGLASLVTTVIGFFVAGQSGKTYAVRWQGAVEIGRRMANAIVEYVGGIQVVKAFSQSAGSYKKYSGAVTDNAQYYVDWMRDNQKYMATIGHRCYGTAVKWCAGFVLILCLQYAVLPAAPRWAATSFSIFVNYARRMLPCLMAGVLMLRRTPLRYLIVGLRKLRLPQNLIIAISVTLRYFPAIREEVGYIRDAMKLRNIRGLRKIECLVVPLMVSATGTAEELSAAAVTRGIENPVRKTSVIQLHAPSMDLIGLAAGVMLTAAAFLIGSR